MDVARARQILRAADELPTRDYRRLMADPEPWLAVSMDVCERAGLDPGTHGRLGTVSSYPVVITSTSYVVKLFGRQRGWQDAYRRESQALGLMSRDPLLAVPRLVAMGPYLEGWAFIVTSRTPGTPLSDVIGEAWDASRIPVGRWLGHFLRRVHALPLSALERAEGWEAFERLITWRYRHIERLFDEADSLTPSLRSQIADFLVPLDVLIGDAPTPVLIHGDLTADHVLGETRTDGFAPIGVIDFGSSRIGHPLWDLGLVWQQTMGMDRVAMDAFVAAVESPAWVAPPTPRHALSWAILYGPRAFEGMAHLDTIADLGELARRAFGGEGDPLPSL